jgi:hypothetical protein
MILPNFFSLGLLLWCALSIGSHAYELSERLEPQGDLKVRLDYHLATSWPTPIDQKGQKIQRTFLWSSHLKFMEPVSKITDAQLWQMVRDGFAEMSAEMERYQVRNSKDTPGGMSILAFGNEVILSSTVKGLNSFAYDYEPSSVKAPLQLCQAVWRDGEDNDQKHKNGGSCGEVMVSQLYYTIHDSPLADQNARVGAVLYLGKKGAKKLEQKPPCGTGRDVRWNASTCDSNLINI